MKNEIKEIISTICEIDIEEIYDDLNLFEEGLLDSLDFIRLSVALSDAFDVDLDPADIDREQVQSVDCILETIMEKKV